MAIYNNLHSFLRTASAFSAYVQQSSFFDQYVLKFRCPDSVINLKYLLCANNVMPGSFSFIPLKQIDNEYWYDVLILLSSLHMFSYIKKMTWKMCWVWTIYNTIFLLFYANYVFIIVFILSVKSLHLLYKNQVLIMCTMSRLLNVGSSWA